MEDFEKKQRHQERDRHAEHVTQLRAFLTEQAVPLYAPWRETNQSLEQEPPWEKASTLDRIT